MFKNIKRFLLKLILKSLLKSNDELIGGFIIRGKKYCIYVSEYGNNSSTYRANLVELLNSSYKSERWEKAFIGENTNK